MGLYKLQKVPSIRKHRTVPHCSDADETQIPVMAAITGTCVSSASPSSSSPLQLPRMINSQELIWRARTLECEKSTFVCTVRDNEQLLKDGHRAQGAQMASVQRLPFELKTGRNGPQSAVLLCTSRCGRSGRGVSSWSMNTVSTRTLFQPAVVSSTVPL